LGERVVRTPKSLGVEGVAGDMGRLVDAHDWRGTPLGPLGRWPRSLIAVVRLMLSSKYPMFLAVGPELRMLYNDAYRAILGDKHPSALGERFDHVWREIWDVVGPLTHDVVESGVPSYSADLPLFMERAGYLEETYFTFSYSPCYDDLGAIDGLFCACVETTDRVLGERRMRAIRDVSDAVRKADSDVEVCRGALASLARHPDVPFAAVYLAGADGSAELAASTGLRNTNRCFRRAGRQPNRRNPLRDRAPKVT
jgi:hypothetical protein